MRPIRLVCPILCALALNAHADPIDLPTVLRLAGAQNVDVQIAQERLNEARAAEESTQMAFFPWVVAGAGYKAHNGSVQTVEGNIITTDKQAYNVGPTVGIQLDLGDALYKRLAARQLTKAAEHGAESQHRQSVLEAAETYFDLCKAQANATVAGEALRTSKEYKDQVGNAVKAGVAFKGDELRAHTQLKRYELLEQQAAEQRRVAAARLAQVLNLDGKVNLTPSPRDLVPLKLAPSGGSTSALVSQALANRPEVKQGAALSDAAETGARGARLGPLVPSLGAQVFGGGLGGGVGSDAGDFGGSGDYQITLGWRIGPGGLFDRSRIRAAESRAKQADLLIEKISDMITREVVESFERVKLLRQQLTISKDGVAAAQEALKLARERKEFAVGIVLETLQSEQDVTKARLDYVNTVMELNKAQYRLKAAVGETSGK
jgi:outer membrane protein TolC